MLREQLARDRLRSQGHLQESQSNTQDKRSQSQPSNLWPIEVSHLNLMCFSFTNFNNNFTYNAFFFVIQQCARGGLHAAPDGR